MPAVSPSRHWLGASADEADVILPSALSLMYPDQGIPGLYVFINELLRENESDIRRCLAKGCAQGASRFHRRPLAIKIDPLGNLLQSFVDLNNLALARFSAENCKRRRAYLPRRG